MHLRIQGAFLKDLPALSSLVLAVVFQALNGVLQLPSGLAVAYVYQLLLLVQVAEARRDVLHGKLPAAARKLSSAINIDHTMGYTE